MLLFSIPGTPFFHCRISGNHPPPYADTFPVPPSGSATCGALKFTLLEDLERTIFRQQEVEISFFAPDHRGMPTFAAVNPTSQVPLTSHRTDDCIHLPNALLEKCAGRTGLIGCCSLLWDGESFEFTPDPLSTAEDLATIGYHQASDVKSIPLCDRLVPIVEHKLLSQNCDAYPGVLLPISTFSDGQALGIEITAAAAKLPNGLIISRFTLTDKSLVNQPLEWLKWIPEGSTIQYFDSSVLEEFGRRMILVPVNQLHDLVLTRGDFYVYRDALLLRASSIRFQPGVQAITLSNSGLILAPPWTIYSDTEHDDESEPYVMEGFSNIMSDSMVNYWLDFFSETGETTDAGSGDSEDENREEGDDEVPF